MLNYYSFFSGFRVWYCWQHLTTFLQIPEVYCFSIPIIWLLGLKCLKSKNGLALKI